VHHTDPGNTPRSSSPKISLKPTASPGSLWAGDQELRSRCAAHASRTTEPDGEV